MYGDFHPQCILALTVVGKTMNRLDSKGFPVPARERFAIGPVQMPGRQGSPEASLNQAISTT
jgi:hypothetical protein